MADTTIDRVLKFREAGKVRRCHLIPHQGEHTVAQHSWDAAVLLLLLHPDPPLRLVKAVVTHDVHERWVSDVARLSLNLHRDFGKVYEEACHRVDNELGISALQLGLTAADQHWLAAVDSLEFMLWCHDQLAAGNRHVEPALSAVLAGLEAKKSRGELPLEVWGFLGQFQWRRTGP